MPPAPPISACILTKNQAHLIRLCIDSVAWCDEILVIDSGSSDATPDLARTHPSGKVRVISHPWLGYNPQRHFAATHCKNPWVLMLDADEECSPALHKELESLHPSTLETAAIFEMPRHNYLARRYVRCWSPDYQTRFLHKDRVLWSPESFPEVRTPAPGYTLKKLNAPLLHNRLTPFAPHDLCDGIRMQERANGLAATLAARGKRATLLQLLTRPALTFLKYYLLRGSFLDGRFGLVIAYKTTIGVVLKYSVLYGRELHDEKTTAEHAEHAE
jgi:glycosyltransferase involved in cell wall biosynthesis